MVLLSERRDDVSVLEKYLPVELHPQPQSLKFFNLEIPVLWGLRAFNPST